MRKILYSVLALLFVTSVASASQFEKTPTFNDLLDVEVASPSNDDVAKYNSTSGDWESALDNPTEDILVYRHVEAFNVNEGNGCTSGAWVKKELTEETADTGNHGSLTTSVITLAAGTYKVAAWVQAEQVDVFQIRLRNTSDSTTTDVGAYSFSDPIGGEAVARSRLFGRFVIASTKTFELQVRCDTTNASSNALGGSVGFDENMLYAEVVFYREGSGPVTPGFRGALVGKSANQTLTSGVSAFITWNTEAYDTDSWHDNVTNNTRLTVPTGVSRVRVCSNVRWQNTSSTGGRLLGIHKNGATFVGKGAAKIPAEFSSEQHICTAAVSVVATDYFEIFGFQDSGSNKNIETRDETWFSIEAIE